MASDGERSIADVLAELDAVGVQLWLEGSELRYRSPKGVMTPERLELLRSRRDDVVAALAAPTAVTHDPDGRYEPFPLTDVQAAYLVGRGHSLPYGGFGCHGYGELRFTDVDPLQLEAAWQRVVQRHDMLRAVVSADGTQRVLPDPPPYRIEVRDVRGAGPDSTVHAVEQVRRELDHKVYQPDEWPLFTLLLTIGEQSILHFSIDFLIADFVSIQLVLQELEAAYRDPAAPAVPLEVTFRDVLLAERARRSGPAAARDRAYWLDRLDSLPEPPDLPVALGRTDLPRFHRLAATLPADTWGSLTDRAKQLGLTPSSALLGAYAEVIGRWSRHPRFTLNVTVLNRPPVHTQVRELVGDFTSVELLAVDSSATEPFRSRAQQIQATLWEDLDHGRYSGVEVIRELRRRHPDRPALFPVVFTSSVGLGAAGEGMERLVHGISQTPQVWLDCQVMEGRDGLRLNWDYREGVLPEPVLRVMFAAYVDLLRGLAEEERWEATSPVPVPAEQAAHRPAAAPGTVADGDAWLPAEFLARARTEPDRPAVVSGRRVLTYRELLERATAVASVVAGWDHPPGSPVAIEMDKGWEQVAAALGVMLGGCAYVPVDTSQPAARRARIRQDADVAGVLTQSWVPDAGRPDLPCVAVDSLPEAGTATVPPQGGAGTLAYVIYTSGSTGSPKGVMISHGAAQNTIADINRRFGVTGTDRVLGLANLGFDLSVYDIFGPLSVGGALVLPDAARRAEPGHWAELIDEHQVTVWNSVPAQMEMLLSYLQTDPGPALDSMRLVLISGDWVPVTLPAAIRGRMPGASLVSLGGATEASIWSIFHPMDTVDERVPSVPYGRPLSHQSVTVLDHRLQPVPDLVAGEIYIGGIGLADGYLGDRERTAQRFIRHPETGERLYRTGDLGRYLPDGTIEFLGREDSQVKIRGHRVELAEIEAALLNHPAAAAAAVVAQRQPSEPLRLAAFVEPARYDDGDPPGGRPSSTADQLAREALTESAGLRAESEDERMLTFARQLDATALLQMSAALRECGLFTEPDAAHTTPEILAGAQVSPSHHRLVRRWLRALRDSGLVRYDATDDTWHGGPAAGPAEVEAGWRKVAELLPAVEQRGELISYFQTTARNLPQLLRGEVDPLRLLFPEGRTEIHEVAYNAMFLSRYLNRVLTSAACQLAREVPATLRVLEVGAGVGGTSVELIPALAEYDVEYLFTDVSEFFLNNARTRFREYSWVDYGRYNLNEDYRQQGLLPNSYDLIVCANVLHYARNVDEAVARLRELLTSGGWLLLIEATRDSYQIMTSMEFLFDETSGDFEDVRRADEQTFLTREQWMRVLKDAASDSTTCITEDDVMTEQMGMHVFASRFKSNRHRVGANDLVAHLTSQVPDHMVPSHYQVVDRLPLSDNGKVDRKALLAWLPSAPGGQAPARSGSDPPATALERRVAELWARSLRVERVGRHQNFFELGGDSLLAAQLATEIRDNVPEAAGVFFDNLLRVILETATVAALADALEREPAGATPAPAVPTGAVGATLVPIRAGSGVATVLLPDAAGSLTCYRPVLDAVAPDVPIAGLRVADPEAYLRLPPDELVDRVAGEYARELVAGGHRRIRLVGCRFGGLLATELARHLTEAGVVVERLVVVASGPVPWQADDDLLLEYLYLRERGVDPALLGDPVPGDDASWHRMRNEPRPARFARLAARDGWDGPPDATDGIGATGSSTGPAERLAEGFRLYAHSTRAVAELDLLPYAGDITLVRPGGHPWLATAPADLEAWWRDLCIGDLAVVDVPGDYFSWPAAGAAALARLLGEDR